MTTSTTTDYDICIAGGGAAAFAMVQRLHGATKKDGSPLKVLVLESSSEEESVGNKKEHQDAGFNPRWRDSNETIRNLDAGSVASGSFLDQLRKDCPDERDFLTRARTRCFGGSTNCWGGWMRPLDSYDFDKWAMKRSVLDQPHDDKGNTYYADALKLVDLQHFELMDDPAAWKGLTIYEVDWFDSKDLEASGLRGAVIQQQQNTKVIGFIDNDTLMKPFKEKQNVTLVRNATVVDIDYTWDDSSGEGIGRITRLIYQGLDPKTERVSVSAKHFVLAMGALEIARLILFKRTSPWFGRMSEAGKYYMNHPKYSLVATARLAGKWQAWPNILRFLKGIYLQDLGHPLAQAYIVPTEDAVRNGLPFDREKKIRNFRTAVSWSKVSNTSWEVKIELNFEQVPNALSRLTLPDFGNKDELGIPRMMIDWRFTREDAETVNNASLMIKNWLQRYDPDLKWEAVEWKWDADRPYPPTKDLHGGSIYTGDHHMGVFHMNSDDKLHDGLVNSSCRVSSSANLWVCSTAVFPTGGWANATCTLLAMSLRLADQLILEC